MIYLAIALALAGGVALFVAGALWETDEKIWPFVAGPGALLLAAALGCASW